MIRNRCFGGTVDAGAVAVAALYHDASEILTGDLPTPIKYYNPAIRDSYKAVESVAQDRLLSMLGEELAEEYEPILKESDVDVANLVKAADKLSAYIKCVEEGKAATTSSAPLRSRFWTPCARTPCRKCTILWSTSCRPLS